MAANPILTTPFFQFRTETTSLDELTVRCSGRLVAGTCEPFKKAICGSLLPSRSLVLDFTDVEDIDTVAVASIIGIYRFAKRADCRLKVSNMSPRVKEILLLTRLLAVLEPDATEQIFGS